MLNKCKIVKLDRHEIGGNRTFIIAEIGSNHNGDIKLAFESIDAAKASKADAVKFQSLNLSKLYHQPSADIQSLHKKIDLDEAWYSELKNYCDKKDIIFFSSPTYLEAVDLLENLGVALYKIASAQAGTFPQLVEKVAKLNKPTIFSTGLMNTLEVQKLIQLFKKCENEKFILLHCNSIYPTPPEKVNLSLLQTYARLTDNPIGFSDHTLDIYIPIAAVAMGAKVIEKHFTLDKKIPSPDASISLEPKRFEEMVDAIRSVESARGDGLRESIDPEESSFKESIIYRLVLQKSKHAGEKFEASDFDFKRYPKGIDCRDLSIILETAIAAKPLNAGEVLDWSHVQLKDGLYEKEKNSRY